jgi:ABC-type polar amino acid transport system ATPase subunit
MIKATQLSLKHNDCTILNNVSFDVPKGRITTFIGQSGAGKTSILKCIANLTKHYTGDVTCDGVSIKTLNNALQAKQIGLVFQSFNLFPNMTVLENCMHPLSAITKISQQKARLIALEKLEMVDLNAHQNKYPSQLSGGQQQRTAIARALCLQPQLLMFDEPTSALDPHNTQLLLQILKNLKSKGFTIALSSHDMTLINQLMDQVYLLEHGSVIESYDANVDAIEQKQKICGFIGHRSFV